MTNLSHYIAAISVAEIIVRCRREIRDLTPRMMEDQYRQIIAENYDVAADDKRTSRLIAEVLAETITMFTIDLSAADLSKPCVFTTAVLIVASSVYHSTYHLKLSPRRFATSETPR